MHQPRHVVDRLAHEERLDAAQRRDGALGGERRDRLADAGDAGVRLDLDEDHRRAVIDAAGPVVRLLERQEERRQAEPGDEDAATVRARRIHSSVSSTRASRTWSRLKPVAYSADLRQPHERVLRQQPHDLALADGDAGGRGAVADGGDHVGHRRHAVVGEVHRDLHGAVLEQQADGLDALHAAVALADLDGDALAPGRGRPTPRLTLKAMSGKRAPMATAPAVACTRASPSSGVLRGLAADDLAHLLEALAADDGEVLVLGDAGRVLVEERGDLRARRRRGCASTLRRLDADRRVFGAQRHERHHVGGAEARVRALVLVQVDQLGGLLDGAERRLGDRTLVADEGHDAAVVRGVALHVEQADAVDAAHGVGDLLDHLGPATLAEVGDALDEGHAGPPSAGEGWWTRRRRGRPARSRTTTSPPAMTPVTRLTPQW